MRLSIILKILSAFDSCSCKLHDLHNSRTVSVKNYSSTKVQRWKNIYFWKKVPAFRRWS